jgi:hypothetical protein
MNEDRILSALERLDDKLIKLADKEDFRHNLVLNAMADINVVLKDHEGRLTGHDKEFVEVKSVQVAIKKEIEPLKAGVEKSLKIDWNSFMPKVLLRLSGGVLFALVIWGAWLLEVDLSDMLRAFEASFKLGLSP